MSELYEKLRGPLPSDEHGLSQLRHFLERESGVIRQALSYAHWRHERKRYQDQLRDIDAVLVVASDREQHLASVRRRAEEMDARRSDAPTRKPAPSPSSAAAAPGGLSWEAAAHEGGHALALLEFGGSVERVELHADGGGRCVGTPPARVQDQLVCIAAGEEAERAIGGAGCSQHDCSADRQEFKRVAQLLEPHERYDTSARALMRAAEFVEDRADDIRRVAAALRQRGSLSGEELARCLGGEETPRPTAARLSAPPRRGRSTWARVNCPAFDTATSERKRL